MTAKTESNRDWRTYCELKTHQNLSESKRGLMMETRAAAGRGIVAKNANKSARGPQYANVQQLPKSTPPRPLETEMMRRKKADEEMKKKLEEEERKRKQRERVRENKTENGRNPKTLPPT